MKKEIIEVSIIMGIYNCQNTLGQSIDSIVNQTYTNWELIMCDDGSIDNTYKIAKAYEEKHPNKIKVLKNENNIRLAATLNKCLRYAKGRYIARMDADDICLPTRFEKQVEFLNKNLQYQVVGGVVIPFDANGEKGIKGIETIPKRTCLITHVPFAHPTIMMRREVYEELGGYTVSEQTTRCEDVDLWFRFFAKGFSGYNIQEPLLKYRESVNDFKRRKIKYSIDTMKVCYKGYKLLSYPKIYYIYLVKPILSALVPSSIMELYHRIKDSR